MPEETMFAVMRLILWKDVKLKAIGAYLPLPICFVPPGDGEIGHLPVFEDYESALKFAGSPKLVFEVAHPTRASERK